MGSSLGSADCATDGIVLYPYWMAMSSSNVEKDGMYDCFTTLLGTVLDGPSAGIITENKYTVHKINQRFNAFNCTKQQTILY